MADPQLRDTSRGVVLAAELRGIVDGTDRGKG
jgi:hypothetical protein